MTYRSRLPLFFEFTPLNQVPVEWKQDIEPHIIRDTADWPGCWIWTGPVDKEGRPTIRFVDFLTKKRRQVRVARMVMKIFWEFDDWHDVKHNCGNLMCLNPHHLRIE